MQRMPTLLTRFAPQPLAAHFKRLVRVKGKKRGLVAVGHSIIVIVYHLLKQQKSYEDLGGDYFDRQNVELQGSRLIKKLEALGLKVTVEVKEYAA
jgi:transposase